MARGQVLRLFVYGSLKREQPNHAQLGTARFVANVRTAPRFALREIAGYPALVAGGRAIEGELFELDESVLPELDAFEGEAYVRREIELSDGSRASTYLARFESAGVPLELSSWPNPEVGSSRT